MTPPPAVDHDVLIVGAGLPGLALALALRESGLSVALVDRRHPAPDASTEWDQRIYAISPGNAAFLHRLGVWPRMRPERMAAVDSMRIFGDTGRDRLDFSSREIGERALAWIVEQRELMEATLAQWTALASPEPIHAGVAPVALCRERNRAVLTLADGRALAARLVVGADGLQSWTREQAGIRADRRPYGQTAVVANFATGEAHNGRAYQWFQRDGSILAFLPLPGHRMSIVWSAQGDRAAKLLALDDASFAAVVSDAASGTLGALDLLTPRASFPLNWLRPETPARDRVALVGDAAHGVHPLAGQGLNLGYGDVLALAEVLTDRGPIADPGDALLLGRYARARDWPTKSMQAVTDGLWRLFGAGDPFLRLVRNRGMGLLNEFAAAKALLMQPAMR